MSPVPDPNSLRQKLLRLSAESGLAFTTLYTRLHRGIPFDQLTQPVKRGKPEYSGLAEIAEQTGIKIHTLRARLRAGVPFEQVANPTRRQRSSRHNDLKLIAQQSGISISTLYTRLRAGVPITAITLPRKRGRRDAISRFQHAYRDAQSKWKETTDRWW